MTTDYREADKPLSCLSGNCYSVFEHNFCCPCFTRYFDRNELIYFNHHLECSILSPLYTDLPMLVLTYPPNQIPQGLHNIMGCPLSFQFLPHQTADVLWQRLARPTEACRMSTVLGVPLNPCLSAESVPFRFGFYPWGVLIGKVQGWELHPL